MCCGGSKWHCDEEEGECGVERVSDTVMRRWVNVLCIGYESSGREEICCMKS